ncbi:MAG: DUF4384 domain-containing protein [Candidatus Eisenbacteria bacterium]|nr:DUF4384 domain-containing protein [Candidatus Eisenbacteria bacterium]
MYRARWWTAVLVMGLALAPSAAHARGLGVDVWTDRGSDAVYAPGEEMLVKLRTSQDAYLLVYEIDSEGYVRVLFPHRGRSGFVEGRRTYHVPPDDARLSLVVQGELGEGYIVAIAAREPFGDLPWYLRPYDPQAEGVGYTGSEEPEQGITSDGRIVGDPFVAMERIRRRVVARWEDRDGFGTAYVTYYVHQRVRYPRYICYDCHRPGRYAWWTGWDPYYSTCTYFDFRVNWGWYWGPGYWFGYVPYYCYVPLPACVPCYPSAGWYSGWDGWRTWNGLWGGHLTRYKSPPPPGYTPPGKWDWTRVRQGARPAPPGFLVADYGRGTGVRTQFPIGANRPDREEQGAPRPTQRGGDDLRRPTITREPIGRSPQDEGRPGTTVPPRTYDRPRGSERPMPGAQPPREERPAPRYERPRESPAPRHEPARESPPPRIDRPREERPAPRSEPPREERRSQPQPSSPSRWEPPSRSDGGSRPHGR